MATLDTLDRLIALPSVSRDPNLEVIGFLQDRLGAIGADVTRIALPGGQKAGLFARIGPAVDGGILLSAHTDTVPAEGQAWTRAPYRMTREGGRLYGRGTTDMKGFVAAMLTAAEGAAARPLARPLLLALSWDEELGCLGIPNMVPHLIPALGRPEFAVVGEPTLMRIATGHKGKAAYLATCHGTAGHSAMAPNFTNALHLAADMVQALRAELDRLAAEGARDGGYDIPYSTVHAGRLTGGLALNIVPDRAEIAYEIRALAAEPIDDLAARIAARAAAITDAFAPGGRIEIAETNRYPGLDTAPEAPVVTAVAAALTAPGLTKVAYGTEAGFFAALGIPTVVCGPGDMAQGHQPDEFIAETELAACDAFLARLTGQLAA